MKPDEPWGTRPWPPHTDPKENTMSARIVPHQLATGWVDLIAISIVRAWAVAASGMLGWARWVGGRK